MTNSPKQDRYFSRAFKPDDAQCIIDLYKTLTGRIRTIKQYSWEWIETWDGNGSAWLMFDTNRTAGDQLVCQYSLIPTPLSFYGNSCLAGKTENCMSHPDLRGKRLYFPHEKEYFEEAKKRFQAFFTTTGKGAPGRVRTKLGYFPLDIWTRYYYFHTRKDCIAYHQNNAKKETKNKNVVKKNAIYAIKYLIGLIEYRRMKRISTQVLEGYTYKIVSKNNSPLQQIEEFWNSNKMNFGITIDRNKEYMNWRIEQNPYHNYKYLLLFKNEILVGYIIYEKDKQELLNILDVVVDKNDTFHFNQIFNNLIIESKENSCRGIICRTVFGNDVLKKAFVNYGSKRKVSPEWIERQQSKGKEVHDFYGVVLDNIDCFNKSSNPINWYITGLFLES